MKTALIITGAWIVGYFITVFWYMLFCRLYGNYEPEDLYDFYNNEDSELILVFIFIWPLAIIILLMISLWLCMKKLMIAGIETIVALRDARRDKDDE